jgi:hypothetical protein
MTGTQATVANFRPWPASDVSIHEMDEAALRR